MSDGREFASNDGRLRWLEVTAFFFQSTTVPLASALAKNVASTCQEAAVMPALQAHDENEQNATSQRKTGCRLQQRGSRAQPPVCIAAQLKYGFRRLVHRSLHS